MDFEAISKGKWSSSPALYTSCSKYIFHAIGCHVQVVQSSNGEIVFRLQGHVKPITCMVERPNNPLQLLTASMDGTGTLNISKFVDSG